MTSLLTFLIAGILLVAVDGHLLRRSGTAYLRELGDNAGPLNQLVTVVFHLATLGLVALIAILPMDLGGEPKTVVGRIGVLLLVLAVAHALTIWTFGRIRARHESEVLTAEVARRS
ncbi:hypothetical protein E1181_06715 [Saccharopolyspora terrae]|jgi:hypothetical protein|uniref:DUF3784 domain-containing protein n=1 Tax=Saccharopolyspora terrae TaxID=2530384 RepID=A0A4R4VWE3_9PSEU|nr:hypothetical protein [Saccharopolyspora terrae]TDD08637.1 hypothetical protein E1181_06715 [Saccharopolyspora terrae]